jgi:hypothetical protein
MARTGGYGDKELTKDQVKDIKRKRNSDLVWLNDTWIYKELHPYIHQANKAAGWNFEWDRVSLVSLQNINSINIMIGIVILGINLINETMLRIQSNGKIRKLSMTCQLTDGSEYEGGELEFDFRNYDPHMREEAKHLNKQKRFYQKDLLLYFLHLYGIELNQ